MENAGLWMTSPGQSLPRSSYSARVTDGGERPIYSAREMAEVPAGQLQLHDADGAEGAGDDDRILRLLRSIEFEVSEYLGHTPPVSERRSKLFIFRL